MSDDNARWHRISATAWVYGSKRATWNANNALAFIQKHSGHWHYTAQSLDGQMRGGGYSNFSGTVASIAFYLPEAGAPPIAEDHQ